MDGYLLGEEAVQQLDGLFAALGRFTPSRDELGAVNPYQRPFILAQADSKVSWKTEGNFTAIGGTFGSETSKGMVFRAKCRMGGIGTGGIALLIQVAGKMEAIRYPFKLLGKPTGAIAKGSSGSVTIFTGGTSPGTEVTTGTNVTAYSRFGAVSANKWCYVESLESGNEITIAECP